MYRRILDPLLTISFSSFSNAWYWVLTGLIWSATCHRTLGVPFDAMVAAHNQGGQSAKDVEDLAHIYVRRNVGLFRKSGVWITAFVCFILAVVATFGFVYTYEMAQGLFALMFPLTIVHALGVRLAFRIERENIRGAELRDVLSKRRFWNQVIGLFSIFVASILTVLSLSRSMVLFY